MLDWKNQGELTFDLRAPLTEQGWSQRELGGLLTDLGGSQRELGGAQRALGEGNDEREKKQIIE